MQRSLRSPAGSTACSSGRSWPGAGSRGGCSSGGYASGRLTVLGPDLYLVGGATLTWEGKLLGLVLSAGEGASSPIGRRRPSGVSTASGRGSPELTVPRGRRFRRASVVVHESTDLDRCGIRRRFGLPLTDPARTLLDLARRTSDRRLTLAIESATEAQADLMVRTDRNAREARSLWAARDQEAAKSDRRWRPPGRDHRQRLRTSGALAAGRAWTAGTGHPPPHPRCERTAARGGRPGLPGAEDRHRARWGRPPTPRRLRAGPPTAEQARPRRLDRPSLHVGRLPRSSRRDRGGRPGRASAGPRRLMIGGVPLRQTRPHGSRTVAGRPLGPNARSPATTDARRGAVLSQARRGPGVSWAACRRRGWAAGGAPPDGR